MLQVAILYHTKIKNRNRRRRIIDFEFRAHVNILEQCAKLIDNVALITWWFWSYAYLKWFPLLISLESCFIVLFIQFESPKIFKNLWELSWHHIFKCPKGILNLGFLPHIHTTCFTSIVMLQYIIWGWWKKPRFSRSYLRFSRWQTHFGHLGLWMNAFWPL